MNKLLADKYSTDWDEIVGLLHGPSFGKLKLFLIRYAFQTVIYLLWNERNKRRHGESPLLVSQIVKMAYKNVRNRLSSIRMAGNDSYNEGLLEWFASQTP